MLTKQLVFHRFDTDHTTEVGLNRSKKSYNPTSCQQVRICAILNTMLLLSHSLINKPVLSLRDGSHIATTTQALIDPNTLQIIGFHCQEKTERKRSILLTQDIRDIIQQGFVVDDYEALSEPADLVKYKSLLDLGFVLIGKQVISDSKRRLGKVSDFAADTDAFYIHKLYATQSLVRSLGSDQLSIDRSQIVEITDRAIIIKDPLQPQTALASPVPQLTN